MISAFTIVWPPIRGNCHLLIYVLGDHFPRLPDEVSASSTETTITISWSFTSVLETRNETFTVLYGTSPGELGLSSPPVSSEPDMQQYSIQLMSLLPGTTYYYQIRSTNRFTSLTDTEERNITTNDSSKFSDYNVLP